MKKGGKIVLSAVSLFLVVGAVVATVAYVRGHDKHLSPQMKEVTQICASTDYKDVCQKSLEKTNTTDPKEFVKTALTVTLDEFKKSFKLAETLFTDAKNGTRTKLALEDCKELFDLSVQELQAALSMVGDSNMHTFADRVNEFNNWLSGVIAYRSTCIDGFEENDEVKKTLEDGVLDAKKLTSNALAIITEIEKIAKAIGFTFNAPASRRLMGQDGYPTWFSAADRKLLAKQDNGRITPNAVVAKDGSGQYRTISEALAAYPKNLRGRYVIYVKAGLYDEYITIPKNMVNIFMYGDGPRKTIVTGHKSNAGGVQTYKTASFSVIGNGFIAKSMGFTNTAGPQGHQAVALRSQSDMSAFFNCRMDGYQDTLYAQTFRQFYRNCVISGTIDFIFGDSTTLIQNSLIIVRRPMDGQFNTVTAHGREEARERTGLVIQNCRIVPEQKLFPDRFKLLTYLGRPWKTYSRTVVMESMLGDFIHPDGWKAWEGNLYLDTLYYAEYGNRGPGANTNRRIKWKGYHVIDRNQALQFTAAPFLDGGAWLKFTGAPFFLGLKH